MSTHTPALCPLPRLPAAGSHRDVGGARKGAMLYDPTKNETIDLPSFALRSGPRKTIYHNPKDVTAAIVTCEHPLQHAGVPAWAWARLSEAQCTKSVAGDT